MGLRDEYRRFSRQVLRTKRWKVLRHEILERDGWKCRRCGSRKCLEVDHIRPVRNDPGRAFDKANLQSLCCPCHTRKTRIECGHPEPSPERRAWSNAVASLTANPTPAKEKKPCWNL